ncbi:MAG TPA: XrtA system polysaccharide chain length determinant [Candidatus Acidoferrales bacterium]|nr:XrtA system polysaccharide chain length determinant [Candidatus Acidoferrales bacterium]
MIDELQDEKSRGIEEYWGIVRRHRWLILLSIFVCWVAVWGIGWLLPATYQSDALILVDEQKVTSELVPPNVSVSLQDRLSSMTQRILSRSRLQVIIDKYHLYPGRSSLLAIFGSPDPVDQMRKDISIEPVQVPGRNEQLTAFKIYYTGSTPELAQAVDNELTSAFIDENMKSQQQLSETATSFFSSQLADARAKLEEQGAKVRAFKAQHMGELPDQLQSNVQILTGVESQLEGTQRALDRAQQQKLYLESIIQQYQSVQTDLGNGDSADTPPALDKELKDLHMQLAAARGQYTDNYPDVIALKDQIAKTEKLKKQIESEIATKEKSGKTSGDSSVDVAAAGMQNGAPTPMMQIESQLKANQLEIQGLQRQEKNLQSRVAEYQARLNSTPITEQALADVSRGYDESQKNYDSLLAKQSQSQLATNLQQQSQGEQFRVLDSARLPDKPASPNHVLLSLGGLVLGIAVGVGLTALFELTDARVRDEEDLQGLLTARVLVGIPRISTPKEDHDRIRMRWMGRAAAVVVVLLIVAGNIYAFYKG